MTKELGNKPVYEDKEGNIHLAIFENKNSKGTVYPLICITVRRFPFKYSQKLWITPSEHDRIKVLADKRPEIEVKKKK